jgi:hypothetical protein
METTYLRSTVWITEGLPGALAPETGLALQIVNK